MMNAVISNSTRNLAILRAEDEEAARRVSTENAQEQSTGGDSLEVQPHSSEMEVQHNAPELEVQPHSSEMEVQPNAQELEVQPHSSEMEVQPNAQELEVQPHSSEIEVSLNAPILEVADSQAYSSGPHSSDGSQDGCSPNSFLDTSRRVCESGGRSCVHRPIHNHGTSPRIFDEYSS